MAQATWEKSSTAAETLRQRSQSNNRLKFMIGGLLILASVAYLIVSGTIVGGRYFITVDELLNNPDYSGQTVRVSGAVLGESIAYDPETQTIEFTISHIPEDFDDLAQALHESVEDPNAARIPVVVLNEVKPDLLQHEAQAILSGSLANDGVFYATELLLKCPSRYEEVAPLQAEPEI
jgi:cytochrome c-type biogenesis protein CcmE